MTPCFGERLKYWRASAGLTQLELANKLGVSKTCIWYWETGKRVPKITLTDRIVHALNSPGMPRVTADRLLVDELPEDYYAD